MKIVVIGGTGLIGSKVVNMLSEHGHDAVAAAPNTGVNTSDGEGLADAMTGASVTIDVSNSPSWRTPQSWNSSKPRPRNLLAAAAVAGVGHYVALSIVGADRSPDSGYRRRESRAGAAHREVGDSLLDRARHPVLRVRIGHRRRRHRRRHGSLRACVVPAHRGRRGCRGSTPRRGPTPFDLLGSRDEPHRQRVGLVESTQLGEGFDLLGQEAGEHRDRSEARCREHRPAGRSVSSTADASPATNAASPMAQRPDRARHPLEDRRRARANAAPGRARGRAGR